MKPVMLSQVLPDELSRKIAWRLAPLMILAYLANQLDRANIGYAALTLNQDLGITTAQYGLAASLFFLGYILFEVPSNLCMHRFGARIWISRIMVTWGTVSSLTCFVQDATWLYIARFVLGVCEAGLFPGMVYYLTLWLPSRDRVWMMSLFVTAIPLTGVLGAPVSTWIMQNVTVFGMSGWRAMIFLEGLPSVLLGIVTFMYLDDNPTKAKWLSASEKATVTQALDAERAISDSGSNKFSKIAAVLTNGRVWALGIVYYGVNCGIISLLYFLPQVIKSFEAAYGVKYSLVQIGMITAIPFSCAVIAMLIWGKLVRKHTITSAYVAGPLFVCAAALALAMNLTTPVAAIASFAVGAAACFCTMTTFWQLPSRFLSDRAAAAGIALITSIGVFSGVTLPYFIGWVKDTTGNFVGAFYGVAVLIVISAIVVIVMEASIKRSIEAEAAAEAASNA